MEPWEESPAKKDIKVSNNIRNESSSKSPGDLGTASAETNFNLLHVKEVKILVTSSFTF